MKIFVGSTITHFSIEIKICGQTQPNFGNESAKKQKIYQTSCGKHNLGHHLLFSSDKSQYPLNYA